MVHRISTWKIRYLLCQLVKITLNMKSKRLLKHTITDLRPLFMTICLGVLGIIVLFIPPNNPLFIFIFIGVSTLLVTLLSFSVKNRRVAFVAAIFTLVGLSMWYGIGFDLINTLLLLSFIIALSYLIPLKKDA